VVGGGFEAFSRTPDDPVFFGAQLHGKYCLPQVMDVRNNFYEKFMYRQYIGEVLAHLWEQPPHR
jgi:hypothetical protein